VSAIRRFMEGQFLPEWRALSALEDDPTLGNIFSANVKMGRRRVFLPWGSSRSPMAVDTPKFLVKSDATIVVPLIFAYVLGE